jgi:vesicle coat complex subunit
LVDDDPYVKKTAAISVAKIYQTMPEHTKDFGFIKLLQGLLQDGNAIVVANAAAALYEISREAGKNYIKANKETIGKLLNALNETNEWGQIYILESIINYKPKEEKEAEEIIERITPRLQHANPAVVLGATKNIMHFLNFVDAKVNQDTILKKLAAPLITLLNAEAEIQYVGLLNILLIMNEIPNVFEKNVKMFF